MSKMYWYTYMNFRGGRTYSTSTFYFIIKKYGKSTRAWPILKSNSTSFWFKFFFHRMNNNNFRKRGPQGAPLLFLYEVNIVVLINFIAILLTPGIFLIQIVNTNNTNVYLIHFHNKNNIKMHFLKRWVLKFQTNLNHSLFIAMWWNKLRWHQQRLPNNVSAPDFQKNNLINNYYIYN